MGILDAPSALPLPRFTHLHAFGNSYVQGAGSDGGTVVGGGGFVGKAAERLGVVDQALRNHAVGGSSVGMDVGGASANCGYSQVLAVLARQDKTITTSGSSGPQTWIDPQAVPSVNVGLAAFPGTWPFGGVFEYNGKLYRYGGYDATPRLTFVYDVEAAIPSGAVLLHKGIKRQSARWGQWPANENRLVIIGPYHDWLGVSNALAPMINGYRTAVARALAANIVFGEGDSFNGGVGLSSGAGFTGGALVDNDNYYTPSSVGGYAEYTPSSDMSGCAFVFGFICQQGKTATWTITVNGTTHGHIDLVPTPQTNRYSGFVYRVPAADIPRGGTAVLRATATTLSGAFASGIGYMSVEARSPTAPVIVMGTTRYPGNAGANDADVVTVNNALRAMVAEFARPDGRNHVRFVDADAILNNESANFYTDNQHPSELGHTLLYQGIMREIRAWQRSFATV